MSNMGRRAFLCGTAALGMGSVVGMASAECPKKKGKREPLVFKNEDFYVDGKFDEEKAKDAIIQLCRYFHYPIFPNMRENLWVSDYGTGKFTELGLACIGFVNNTESPLGETFMLQDLYLLPNQMLPEHWHIQGKLPIKNEGWFIRNGQSLIVGIGEDNLPADIQIPKCHMNGTVETRHSVLATPGTYVQLAKVESKHWQMAGPEGCILSEVANLHENEAVRHNDPAINDNFLGK